MQNFFRSKLVILVGALAVICVIAAGILVLPGMLKPTFLVQFDSAGGTAVKERPVKEGATVGEAPVTEKYGFNFIEWQLDGAAYDFSTPVTTDIVLKAVWEANGETTICTVYFFSDGGSDVEPIEVSEGYSITPPIDPVREGYAFAGWYLGETEKFDFSTPVTQSLLLTARWESAGSTEALGKDEPSPSGIAAPGDSAGAATAGQTNGNSTSPTATGGSGVVTYGDDDVTWDDIKGTWYLTGSDDVTFTVTQDSSGNTKYSFKNFTQYDGLHYGYNQGDSLSSSIIAPIFAAYLGITFEGNSFVINTKTAGSFTFYRQQNYPSHIEYYFEKLYNNLQGRWYADGYGDDVYIEFTVGTNNGEKVVFMNTYNLSTGPAKVNLYNGSRQTNFAYYSLEIYMDYYDILYNNGVLTMESDGQPVITFSRTAEYIPVSSLTLSPTSINVQIGYCYYFEIYVTVNPEYATNREVTWSTSNPNVVGMTADGAFYAAGVGTANIIVTSADGITATCVVTVAPIEVTSITLDKTSVNLTKGGTSTLKATVSPQNATYSSVTWSSSNTSVATVSGSGVVTAISGGSAIITATTADGSHSASCTVTVSVPALSVHLNIAYTIYTVNSTTVSGMEATAYPSGGSGSYTYYYIKMYYNGTLIGETTNTGNYWLFVEQTNSGTYSAEVTVRDSAGNTATGTASLTIS